MKRILILLAVLLLLPFSLKIRGQDFGKSQSLFSDIKAHRVGDILTVLIVEQNRASSQVESKTEKEGEASLKGGPGLGPLDFIPLFGADAKMKKDFEGKGENLRTGSVRAKMSVTVIEVRPNGDLVIEGSRVLGISGDKETLNLSGVVRTKDIKPDNSIESYLIAEAHVTYTGKGNTNTGARPGLISRIVNWIF
ncbi:MAG: flagellar basal body L-ring protein FlgH [Candidatus Zixiibacteriota bacterium]|nr:MAG: flagellar basal body L-ring protein FlgH [candidate division Zixibacteria bacterium]